MYEEATVDATTGAEVYTPLGHEAHHGIEQVLLPLSPTAGNPIFLTKKFIGHPEYRWQVHSVHRAPGANRMIYRVLLIRRTQIDKQYYLKNILASRRKGARSVLHPWALVEVEFGHHFNVGDATGNFKESKQYVDTIQLYSMPKRRLAVVTQVIERKAEDLVQVIPISSKLPEADEQSTVEVTSQLIRMVHYQKRSWAICTMIQTVTASRIIAPLVARTSRLHSRDPTFGIVVRGHIRTQLKDAILHGVAAGSRISDTQSLMAEKALSARLSAEVASMETKLELFALYEQVAADSKLTLDEMRQLFPQHATHIDV
ncbi:type II toxin-antitoxin system PemK/MazF family toxin [Cupriavidus pampae]|nr:type II toxin-antitoxin system PemK/MazF family toxin [Cupriavidus pampae]